MTVSAYPINLTNGSTLIPGGLQPNTLDTSHSSLTLIGQDTPNYGKYINNNFIHLLENFAYSGQPPNPLIGQLWWDTNNNILRVWSGTSWKISTGATAQGTQPSDLSGLGGDLWWDTTNYQLKVSQGPGQPFITIGPLASKTLVGTGAFPDTITDSNHQPHNIIRLEITGTTYAIISGDASFTTNDPTFPTVTPGLNFAVGVGQTLGLNIQSQAGSIPYTLVQRDKNAAIFAQDINSGTQVVVTNSGYQSTLAAQGLTTPAISLIGYNATSITPGQVSANVISATKSLSVGSSGINSTGLITAAGGIQTTNGSSISVTGGGSIVVGTGGLLPSANVIGTSGTNIGSPTLWFNNIYGTAVHAQYADLAERFAADAEYAPGTVVEMGGEAEITQVSADLSEDVFGVISTNAAYLMNSRAGTNATHPPIAVQGRVPVRVIGQIRKGDRLVSAGNGLARAGKRSEITTWNVIGRALENKTTDEEGTIEAVVKLNS